MTTDLTDKTSVKTKCAKCDKEFTFVFYGYHFPETDAFRYCSKCNELNERKKLYKFIGLLLFEILFVGGFIALICFTK